MPYSSYTLKRVRTELNIELVENKNLFSQIGEVRASDYLTVTLDYNVPLALAINTEKARSEFIISNVLLEVKRVMNDEISVFSGVNLDVDKDRELNGFCDYIVSKSSEQFYIHAPIIVLVEAKNENIAGGLGQCIAEMAASDIFNRKESNSLSSVYGSVTTGNTWKFLKYQDGTAYIDKAEYHISNIGKILGIMIEMAKGTA